MMIYHDLSLCWCLANAKICNFDDTICFEQIPLSYQRCLVISLMMVMMMMMMIVIGYISGYLWWWYHLMVDLPTAGDDPGCDPLLGLAAENIPPGRAMPAMPRMAIRWLTGAGCITVRQVRHCNWIYKIYLKENVMLSYTYMIPFYWFRGGSRNLHYDPYSSPPKPNLFRRFRWGFRARHRRPRS